MRLALVLRFLVFGLILHVGFSWLYLTRVCVEHEAWIRDTTFLERERDVSVLVVGASHANMAVLDQRLPNTLNIATHGEHYLRMKYRLQWLLEQDPDGIETVLVPFDAAGFTGFKNDHFRPEAVWGRYVPYLELGRERGMPRDYFDMWFRSKLAPYAGELTTLGQFVIGRRAFRRKGSKRKVTVERQTAAQIAERHVPRKGEAWDPVAVAAFTDIVHGLKDRGIRVVLVSYPVHAAYSKHIQERGVDPADREQLLATLLEPGTVDHVDAEALFPDKRLMFADPDHLSPLGALAFTKHLSIELDALGVLEADQNWK